MPFVEKISEHLSHVDEHLRHVHPHHSLPNNQDYSQMFNAPTNVNSSSGGGGALAMLGASMAAHPVVWAIGAVVIVGVVGYTVYSTLKED